MSTTNIHSKTEILGKNAKPTMENILLKILTENTNNNNLVTNVGDINYTEGEQLLQDFKEITEPFCDNIMVAKILDFRYCEGKPENGHFLVKKASCSSCNSNLRADFSEFKLAGHGVKAKKPYLLNNETKTASGIRQVIGASLEKYKSYENPVFIPFKVELADVKLETLLQKLPGILKNLKELDFYLLDLDITQDFAGIFNKEEMKKYLTSNFSFSLYDFKEENVIVENDKTVGKDCLTWLNVNSRAKIYNKFVCQMTSPGVNKKLGNHVIDYLNCPDKRLKETFESKLAQKNGITRLEVTIYNYTNEYFNAKEKYDPIAHCMKILEKNKSYFPKAPFYSVPISIMWEKLTNTLENSCCIVDNTSNKLNYVYWANKNTNKLTGINIKLSEEVSKREKVIKYVLSAFSFPMLPINYIEITEVDNEKISVIQKCFLKREGKTYFTKNTTLYSSIKILDIERSGLIATKNVTPEVLRKRTNITNALSPYVIEEVYNFNKVYLEASKKRELELENIKEEERRLHFLNETKTKNIKMLDDKAKRETLENKILEYFRTKWIQLGDKNKYILYAFMVDTRHKYPYVVVLVEENNSFSVRYIKGVHKNFFINKYKNKQYLKEKGFCFLSFNKQEIVYLPKNEHFMILETDGYTSYNGNRFPSICDLHVDKEIWGDKGKALEYNQDTIENLDSNKMEDFIGKIPLVKDCIRLETIGENVQLTIRAIAMTKYRGKNRYIFAIENTEHLYISNYWMEKSMENSQIDFNRKIKIQLDLFKITPSKNKELRVFCSN